jgi:pyrroline-5-carboxylate reductase
MSTLSESKYQVGVIGVGVMGEALLAGLVSAGFPKVAISFAEKRTERADEIKGKYGATHLELDELLGKSDVVLLVVKPQDLGDLLTNYGAKFKSGALVLSFAAGKNTKFISSHLNPDISVIRVMPNTPTLIGKGMAAISAGPNTSNEQLAFVSGFLEACGKVITVDESLQDAVTAVSGSGPAYIFAFAEEMIAAAIALGLSEEDASTLTIQTIVGAAGMLDESGLTPTKLRENVTSPNGTTAAALAKFSEGQLGDLISKAMKAAKDRSAELA